jgi:hypothetical protein
LLGEAIEREAVATISNTKKQQRSANAGTPVPRILFALAFTLLTAYALVAMENQLVQVFGPLRDADLAVVLQ